MKLESVKEPNSSSSSNRSSSNRSKKNKNKSNQTKKKKRFQQVNGTTVLINKDNDGSDKQTNNNGILLPLCFLTDSCF